MSLRTALLPIVERARAITGSDALDQRPSQLTIRKRTWSGGAKGSGTATDADLELPQHYKVRQLSTREVAGSGGRYEMGDVSVVVTPEHRTADGDVAGYSQDQLAPVITRGTELLYVLSGQVSGEYRRIELKRDRAYRYTLVLRRLTSTP